MLWVIYLSEEWGASHITKHRTNFVFGIITKMMINIPYVIYFLFQLINCCQRNILRLIAQKLLWNIKARYLHNHVFIEYYFHIRIQQKLRKVDFMNNIIIHKKHDSFNNTKLFRVLFYVSFVSCSSFSFLLKFQLLFVHTKLFSKIKNVLIHNRFALA